MWRGVGNTEGESTQLRALRGAATQRSADHNMGLGREVLEEMKGSLVKFIIILVLNAGD